MCKSWCELVVAVVILAFTLIPTLSGMTYSKWIIAIAALVLLVHSFTCKSCFMRMPAANVKSKRR